MDLERYLPDIAVAAALAWGSGLRAYAVIFAVGLAGALGWMELPGLDTVWDAAHSFIRIPAGAALAAAVFGDSGTAVALAAAILGGTLAAGAHLAKAGTRAAINTSPEPFTNWTASLAEDAIVPFGLWLAVAHPIAFFVLLALFLVAAALLVRLIWRGLRRLLRA